MTPDYGDGIYTITRCCAWRTYHGLNAPEWELKDFTKVIAYQDIPSAVLFNGSVGESANGGNRTGELIEKDPKIIDSRCQQIMDFITDNELGDIYELPRFKNGDYGKIISFVWLVDMAKFTEYKRKNSGFSSNFIVRLTL